MSPALNRSSALQHFEHGNVVEISNGIMFDFYPRLPHVYDSLVLLLGPSSGGGAPKSQPAGSPLTTRRDVSSWYTYTHHLPTTPSHLSTPPSHSPPPSTQLTLTPCWWPLTSSRWRSPTPPKSFRTRFTFSSTTSRRLTSRRRCVSLVCGSLLLCSYTQP